MVFLLDAILKTLEQRDTVAQICLIDFKEAFDNIDPSVAVTQLYHFGCLTSLPHGEAAVHQIQRPSIYLGDHHLRGASRNVHRTSNLFRSYQYKTHPVR